MEKNTIKQVEEFFNVFQPNNIGEVGETLSYERRKLRVKLLYEELHELSIALGCETYFTELGKKIQLTIDVRQNEVEILDALSDLQYVLDGAYIELGLHSIKNEAFKEVHNSNMSKACNTEKEALKTVKYYKEKGIETHYDIVRGKYVVYRTDDDKVLKSINYKPPNLKHIIEDYNGMETPDRE